jgi:hypothetical protein
MLNSGIIDVAIGMIFVYLLLSLICSAANEVLERIIKKRASDLERGLQELLNDCGPSGLVQRIYDHPFVNGLFKGKYLTAKQNRELPSYIPARNFALALLDIVAPANGGTSGAANTTTSAAPLAATKGELVELRSIIASLPTIGPKETSSQPQGSFPEVAKFLTPEVKQAFLAFIDASGNDPQKLRENIEGWFNSAMDRVSGWYKRRSQLTLIILGLVVAGITNADSITIANRLSTDKAMRDSLVAAAQEYARTQKNRPSAPANASPAPSPKPSPTPPSDLSGACKEDPTSAECRVETNLNVIQSLGLPIGWSKQPSDPRSFYVSWEEWTARVLGWIITALAISLGAPFWFDLLNKFIVVRSTVKPHEKSQEEKSKS